MVNPIPADPQPVRIDAPELADDIVARPLVAPDFTNPKPKNPNVCFRWIEFKARDGFRYQQCIAQGFSVAKKEDLANPEAFTVYSREMGTKFINGDVILMKIDRARYLGALKHRQLKTQALTNPAVVKAVSVAAASGDLIQSLGKMSPFIPGDSPDISLKDLGVDVSKIPGIRGTPGVESKTGGDVRNEQFQTKGDQ